MTDDDIDEALGLARRLLAGDDGTYTLGTAVAAVDRIVARRPGLAALADLNVIRVTLADAERVLTVFKFD